jgi:hypothetical protein
MPYYRLYHIKHDRFAGVDDFEVADDVAAVRHAAMLNGSGSAELWCGKRKIKTFEAAPAPARGAEAAGGNVGPLAPA